MDWLVNALRQHPEVALFLTLAVGYALGRIKFGSVQLGAVTGVLIAGVVIGQVGVAVSPDLSSAFFLLFLFSIGYKTGPQFVNGLRTSGVTQVGLTVFLCVTGLLGAGPRGRAGSREEQDSDTRLGVTYAIGNVLLALWSSVMVVLMAR